MARFFTNRGIKVMTMVVTPTHTSVSNGIPVVTQGKRLTFNDSELITNDTSDIKFLRGHKNFNNTFFEDKEETAKTKVKV